MGKSKRKRAANEDSHNNNPFIKHSIFSDQLGPIDHPENQLAQLQQLLQLAGLQPGQPLGRGGPQSGQPHGRGGPQSGQPRGRGGPQRGQPLGRGGPQRGQLFGQGRPEIGQPQGRGGPQSGLPRGGPQSGQPRGRGGPQSGQPRGRGGPQSGQPRGGPQSGQPQGRGGPQFGQPRGRGGSRSGQPHGPWSSQSGQLNKQIGSQAGKPHDRGGQQPGQSSRQMEPQSRNEGGRDGNQNGQKRQHDGSPLGRQWGKKEPNFGLQPDRRGARNQSGQWSKPREMLLGQQRDFESGAIRPLVPRDDRGQQSSVFQQRALDYQGTGRGPLRERTPSPRISSGSRPDSKLSELHRNKQDHADSLRSLFGQPADGSMAVVQHHFRDMTHTLMNPEFDDHPNAQKDLPDKIVEPLPSTKQRNCPVCVRKVPLLLSHANARHLPWFVNAVSACGACHRQFNYRTRLEGHIASEHPGKRPDQVRLPPPLWAMCMDEYFSMVADALGIDVDGIPEFVTEHTLFDPTKPVVTEAEQVYFDEPISRGSQPFNPVKPVSLRDCSHWKTVLRLIAAAGGKIGSNMVRTSNPDEGFVFLAEKNQKQPQGSTQQRDARQEAAASNNTGFTAANKPFKQSFHDDDMAGPSKKNRKRNKKRQAQGVSPATASQLVDILKKGDPADHDMIRKMARELLDSPSSQKPDKSSTYEQGPTSSYRKDGQGKERQGSDVRKEDNYTNIQDFSYGGNHGDQPGNHGNNSYPDTQAQASYGENSSAPSYSQYQETSYATSAQAYSYSGANSPDEQYTTAQYASNDHDQGYQQMQYPDVATAGGSNDPSYAAVVGGTNRPQQAWAGHVTNTAQGMGVPPETARYYSSQI